MNPAIVHFPAGLHPHGRKSALLTATNFPSMQIHQVQNMPTSKFNVGKGRLSTHAA